MLSRITIKLSVLALMLLLLGSFDLAWRGNAQTTNSEVIAPGFDWNKFADPDNVPEFALNYGTGPVSMAFDSRGRLFVGTYSGKILILLDNNGDGRVDQVKTFATGLVAPLGLEFRANGDLFMSTNVIGGVGRILRLRDTNGDDVADEITTIVDNLPSQGDHQTNKLKFGPDGLLYFSQGSSTDAGTPTPIQPPEGPLNAAMLRVNVDSPNPQVEVVATGLRNAFGMAFHPENNQLFATDIGSGELCQSTPTNPCGGEDLSPLEEVNWVVPGGKYGFPNCEGLPVAGNPACAGVRGPIITFGQHLTPTSITFYTGPQAGDSKNQMLVTLFKPLHGLAGDLKRFVLTGSAETGFQGTEVLPAIIDFGLVDPGDGPVDTAIDPISGDIYSARFDPVHHADPNEHHHFIYRVHRVGSDSLPFIGPFRPSAVKAGTLGLTVSVFTRHAQPGAVVFDVTDDLALATRTGASAFELVADLPASVLATDRTIMLAVRNPDSVTSNQQPFNVTKGDPNPDPNKIPQIASMFVYKKKRSRVIDQLFAGMTGRKLRLVVDGADFDSGAQLLVNNTPLELESTSSTELVGRMTNSMVAIAGDLTIQVRNSTGKTSTTFKLTVSP